MFKFIIPRKKLSFLDREVHFFNSEVNYKKGLSWYKKQMPFSKPGMITMEKTPGYFIYTPKAPQRIKKMNPNIKWEHNGSRNFKFCTSYFGYGLSH